MDGNKDGAVREGTRAGPSRIRRAVFWLLPIVILSLIFSGIDGDRMLSAVRGADPVLFIAGVCCFPLTLLVGAARWRMLIAQYWGRIESLGLLFRQYSIGLSMSVLLPGQIGMDIYRVSFSARRYGRVVPNIEIVIEEKVLSLGVCVALVLGLSPWIAVHEESGVLRSIQGAGALLLAGGGIGVLGVATARRSQAVRSMVRFVAKKTRGAVAGVLARTDVSPAAVERVPSFGDLFHPMTRVRSVAPVLVLSIANFLVLAVANQLFLAALGVQLPFHVSCFVVSVLFLVVLVPVSFAGLGVREGAYILLFQLFGVGIETAFAISMFALAGMLINYGIGGLAIYAASGDVTEKNA